MNIQFNYTFHLAIKTALLLLIILVAGAFIARSSGKLNASSPDDLPLCIELNLDSENAPKATSTPDINATPTCRLHTTAHEISTPNGRSMSAGEALRITQEAGAHDAEN